MTLFIGLILFLSAIGVPAVRGYRLAHKPHYHSHGDEIISVPQGMTTTQIYNMLRDRSILPDALAVRIWVKLKASRNTLKAGDYLFESPITPAAVIEKLTRGYIYTQSITFPEGLTRFEIADLIRSLNIIDSAQADEPMEQPALLKLIQDLDPKATDPEGYLFPDTYQYTSTTTAGQLITQMVKRFRKVFTPDDRQRAQQLGLSVREVVTLASMIEREARIPDDRSLISSVYHNRLRLGMKLDCDPTVIYASLLAGTWSGTIRKSDLERPSPYNTYLSPGLPPGPIASPGRASIEAALYPADTQNLYFVLDAGRDDGAHRFSAKLKQHLAHVAEYRLSQRRRTQEKHGTTP
jgi:UPF0755 protein